MWRRIGPYISLLAVLLCLGGCKNTPKLDPNQYPNIVFILADDLGWRDTSVYGSTFYQTPAIDGLAKAGIRFTNAYAANPLCSPTRASLMTGLAPGRLRLTSATGHFGPDQAVFDPVVVKDAPPHSRMLLPESRTQLSTDYTTYAELFQRAGYKTAFMGKWHLGDRPYGPADHGFDKVVGGTRHAGPPGGYFAPWPISSLPKAPEGTHIADVLADEAVKFISKNKDRPFLLNYWLYDVHGPFEGEENLRAKYQKQTDPQGLQSSETMGAMTEAMDRGVGKVLAAIDDLGLKDNTIIIFTSDNGGNEYNIVDSGVFPTNNAPLKGGKAVIYDGGTRVPFIARWPGKFPSGRVNETAVVSMDIYPTLLSLAGLKWANDGPLDGIDISPALMGKPMTRRPIFNHFPHDVLATANFASTSVIDENWKLIRFYARNADLSDKLELYDLSKDPREANDLSAEQLEKTQYLNNLISDWLVETGSLIPLPNPASNGTTPNDAARARLKSEAKKIFTSVDSDKNGQMLFREYRTLSPERHAADGRDMFAKIDTDTNKKVSPEEFEAYIISLMDHLGPS